MNNNWLSTKSRLATHTAIVCGLLAFSVSAVAQVRSEASSRARCSNRTLNGDYGCSVQGVLLNVPGLPPEATFVGVTTAHFDGQGNTTGTEHAVVNGMSFNPGWDTNGGTYTVNPDCTGRATVTTPNSPVPLDLYLVVMDNGEEIRQVLNANALLTICKKMN
jgi:hypothetical protein